MNAPGGGKPVAPALADFITLNEEIAALVRARIPLEPHLAHIGAELPGKAGELAERIGRRLESGESFARAIEVECASMPAIYRATLVAGVESGQLGSAVEALVDSASRIDQLRRITGQALVYPMMIVLVTLALLILIVTAVIPQFGLLTELRNGPLVWLLSWRNVGLIIAIIVLLAVLIAASAWWRQSTRVGIARWKGFQILRRLSGARGIHYWSQAATFADLLLLVVERGLPLDHALRLAANATDDARLRDAAERLAQHIERGGSVRETGCALPHEYRSEFPLLIRLALYHSANRPLFAGSLSQAATMYRERAIRAAEWYAEYVPILLTVGIGGTLTIAFTLLVLWPYASILYELAG